MNKLTNRRRTWIIAGGAGALLLAGGATAAYAAESDDADPRLTDAAEYEDAVEDTDDGDDLAQSELPADAYTADEAIDAALTEIEGTVDDVELEGTADAPVWVVEVVDADGIDYDITVDAFDGTVIDAVADDADDADEPDDEDDSADDGDDDGPDDDDDEVDGGDD
ncbi:PepSY domain-containing protein [Glycomyces buryatensis]|uniref:PepSY domain-containing protein n=1 Tax=Glycomyces buryatensis TaxID=2570927 RepID=A0A4S8PZL2_9ACTN|nr:PepSY domain-containing protein [Glycomyces buryatensis]THV35615.1 hypothetical protein FAB82_22320 [Glycomyces buryatensis]